MACNLKSFATKINSELHILSQFSLTTTSFGSAASLSKHNPKRFGEIFNWGT
jgi:hypothetical protein